MSKKLLLMLLIIVLLAGCKEKSGSHHSTGGGRPPGSPQDYFPTKVGTSWTYKIRLGSVKPVLYEVFRWPQGSRTLLYATKGFYGGGIGKKEGEELFLKMRVRGIAQKQGELEYPIGVELEIEKDELKIFDYSKKVFFAATSHGRFMAHRVETRDYSSPGSPSSGAWGGWGEDGYSMPLIFFAEKPGIGIGMGDDSPDTLFFRGRERSPSGHSDSLHFQRIVDAQDKKEKGDFLDFDRRFTEDTWFARGKGLVYLIQKIEGQTSMTWELIDFSQ